jgi:hypothetical protein
VRACEQVCVRVQNVGGAAMATTRIRRRAHDERTRKENGEELPIVAGYAQMLAYKLACTCTGSARKGKALARRLYARACVHQRRSAEGATLQATRDGGSIISITMKTRGPYGLVWVEKGVDFDWNSGSAIMSSSAT